jgi:AbiU2
MAKIDDLSNAERIAHAKAKMEKVLDHFLYLLELHENNAIIVYSNTLSSQIPHSFAANAFNMFQRGMHQFEIVRLCALWDRVDIEKENIPTVIELIDDEAIIDSLAEETRQHWANHGVVDMNASDDPETRALVEKSLKQINVDFGNQQATKAKTQLLGAIDAARKILESAQLATVMNLRHKHLAHSLASTRLEVRQGPVDPMKYGDETAILEASIPIIEHLFCWVAGKGFTIEDSRKIDRKNAQALWHGCTFKVLRWRYCRTCPAHPTRVCLTSQSSRTAARRSRNLSLMP